MLHRSLQLTIGVFAATYPVFVFAQAAASPQYFVVCGSQPNLPTIYFSGVLQGPTAAFAGFRAGFTEYLLQHYAYKGAVGCLPTNSAANAQNFISTRSTAFRTAKKIVVDTGWTEDAAAAAPVAAAANNVQRLMPQVKAAAPLATAPGVSSGSAGGASQLTSVFGSIFGTGGGTGSGACGGTGESAAKAAAAGASHGASGAGAAGSGGTGCQSPFEQVSNALTSAFGNKSTNSAASAEGAPRNPQPGIPDGGLGSAQTQATKLVVYGCGRQDTQVACVSELINQNQKDTLVQAADVWKDSFIVDDRGDRHQRTAGFFLNVDGDQRPQLDISYGKSARFILMFDGVQAKVQKVALRSATGGLDVEEISLIVPNAGAQAGQQH